MLMTKISCETICLTDFETSQTEATLASHCPMDWSYFEHCQNDGQCCVVICMLLGDPTEALICLSRPY